MFTLFVSASDHGDQLNDELPDAAFSDEAVQQASENLEDRSEEGTEHNQPVYWIL